MIVPQFFARTPPPVLTRRIDAALAALADCRARVPALRDLYPPGCAEHSALDDLLGAANRAAAVLAPSSIVRRRAP